MQNTATSVKRTDRVRDLNDCFRKTLIGGRVVMTPGIAARTDLQAIVEKVMGLDAFDAGNDPWAEHDFGAIEIKRQKLFWKIDYYDLDLNSGSPDPSDPAVTTRVMTIMLAEEY